MDTEQRDNILNLNERVGPHAEEQTPTNIQAGRSKTESQEQEDAAFNQLKSFVSLNVPGCDLAICIFAAALKSFKVDQCLRPFPQCFINENNEKDFVSLVSKLETFFNDLYWCCHSCQLFLVEKSVLISNYISIYCTGSNSWFYGIVGKLCSIVYTN